MSVKLKIFLALSVTSLLWGGFSVWISESLLLSGGETREELVESQNLLLSSLASELSQKAYGYMRTVDLKRKKLSSKANRKRRSLLLKRTPMDFFILAKSSGKTNVPNYFVGSTRLKLNFRQVKKLLQNLPSLKQKELFWWQFKSLPEHKALLLLDGKRLFVGFYGNAYFHSLASLSSHSFFLVDRRGIVVADKKNSYGGAHLKRHPAYKEILKGQSLKGSFLSPSKSRDSVKKKDWNGNLNLESLPSYFQKVAGTNLFVATSYPASLFSFSGWQPILLGLCVILLLSWTLVYVAISPTVRSLDRVVKNIFKLNRGGERFDSLESEALPFGVIEELNSLRKKLASKEDKNIAVKDSVKSRETSLKPEWDFLKDSEKHPGPSVSEEDLAIELFSKWSESNQSHQKDGEL